LLFSTFNNNNNNNNDNDYDNNDDNIPATLSTTFIDVMEVGDTANNGRSPCSI